MRAETSSRRTNLTETTKVKGGKGEIRALPLITGQPVKETAVDTDEIVAYLRLLEEIKKNGKLPHRGRIRGRDGKTSPDRPVRNINRRGDFKSQ